MVKLILVRHALTVDNQKSRLSGHIDSSISEEGKEQIDKITNYLKDFDIDKIYTTTSSRTKDTVKKLSELKSIEIIEKESLKEISFGDFEGLTFDEIDVYKRQVVILSTCNRSEIYIQAKNIDEKIKLVEDFYEEFFNAKGIKEYLFSKKYTSAIEHLFKVASGLDSIVLGEDQILGQVKDAHDFSMQLGSSKKIFNKLFREAVNIAKRCV